MPSKARISVAEKLIASLRAEGYEPNCHPQKAVAVVADAIWTASGGSTKLDVARWGLDLQFRMIEPPQDCIDKGSTIVPVAVGSWLTLTAAARSEALPLIRHSHRKFEV